MNSKTNKIPLTFNDLARIMDFEFVCSNCGVDEYCDCAKNFPNSCYCHDAHKALMSAITHYSLRDDLSKLIAVFQELEGCGFTMLDCADFIHRLNEKLPQLQEYYMSEQ